MNRLKLFALVLLLLFCSCSDHALEFLPEEEMTISGTPLTVFATQATGTDTRIIHEDTGDELVVNWTMGEGARVADAFRLYSTHSGKGTDFKITAITDGKASFFSENINDIGVAPYNAFYPARNASTISWEDNMFDISGQEQDGSDATKHLEDYNFMILQSDIEEELSNEMIFSFQHQISVFRLTIKLPEGAGIPQSLRLSTGGAGFVSKYSLEDGSKTYAPGIDLSLKNIILDDDNSFVAYIAVLPCVIEDSLTCRMVTEDGVVYESTMEITTENKSRFCGAGYMYTGRFDGFTRTAFYKVGDYWPDPKAVYNDGILISGESAKGVVFWLDPMKEGYMAASGDVPAMGIHGKVVSLTEGVSFTWGPKVSIMDARSTTDGWVNMGAVAAYVADNEDGHNWDDFGAFKWVTKQNGHVNGGWNPDEDLWYLPAKEELKALYAAFNGKVLENIVDWGTNVSMPGYNTAETLVAQDKFNQILKDAGGTILKTSLVSYYWSSSESANSFAWYVYFYNGNTYDYIKSDENRVRCSLAF